MALLNASDVDSGLRMNSELLAKIKENCHVAVRQVIDTSN